MVAAPSWVLIAMFLSSPLVTPLPILPEDMYCHNASLHMQLSAEGKHMIAGGAVCDGRPLGESGVCCDAEDMLEVLQELEGSQNFLLRNLEDRQMFLDQYSKINFGEHPCAQAGTLMISARLERLAAYQEVSKMISTVLGHTVRNILCAACDAGVSSPFDRQSVDEAELAFAWKKLSTQAEELYRGVRAHDAAVAAELKQGTMAPCVLDFVEASRRGVAAPAGHVVPLRRWKIKVGQEEVPRIHSFAEVWKRWVDSMAALSSEFAEGIQHECEGIMLGLQQGMQQEGVGRQLLVEPPKEVPGILSDTQPQMFTKSPIVPRPSLSASSNGQLRAMLLVAMPNPGTDLRFDFANDPFTLNEQQLGAHAAALQPLARSKEFVRVVIVTSNPDEAAFFSKYFSGCDHDIHVVWRRYALFNPDALAALYAEQPPPRDCSGFDDASASRAINGFPKPAVLVFRVKPGGAAADLRAAVSTVLNSAVGFLPHPSSWPPALTPAMSLFSAWLTQAKAAEQSPMLLASPSGAGVRCPAIVHHLSQYLRYHRDVRARLRELELQPSGTIQVTDRILIYRCSALGFCGGHADRLNGLLGIFLIAVAAGRAFFIDSPRPVPLHTILGPRRVSQSCLSALGGSGEFLLDWRMHGAMTAAGRRTNYNDRYTDLVADLPWLISEESEPVVVVRSNQRITMPTLQSRETSTLLGHTLTRDLLAMPYLHAELTELLFEPSPLLAARVSAVLQPAKAGKRRLIAIHFRAGDKSPGRWQDPPRHQLSDLDRFLACAASVEKRLGWSSADVAWYLAADTSEVASSKLFTDLQKQGKITMPSAGNGDAAIIHLDRSPMHLSVHGIVDTWAQWLVIGAADAAVLSASGFGITAAESGRIRHAYIGLDCMPTDLTAA